jgi:hypothetical protein
MAANIMLAAGEKCQSRGRKPTWPEADNPWQEFYLMGLQTLQTVSITLMSRWSYSEFIGSRP